MGCVPELRITLPAHEDSLVLLRHVVRGFREAYGVAPATMDDIVLAVSEAATNVVVHAYGRRGGTITVVARSEDGVLQILVRDHGQGIAAPADTPLLGHGLALMEHVAETLEIVGTPAGTDVSMTFELTADSDPAALGDFDIAS
ncbi:MAG: serine/threonine-protein kinase RsbW [Solirubrobacteraceae bacterium]|nr:serine/threonine-protein kinase RsbW [Solirubrobacteraceae bacterium]